MDWLQSLLWDPSSVAHIVLLYAFVVAAGVYLGKIKIFGVSLGVLCEFSLKKRFVLTYWLYLQVERLTFRKR